MRQRVFLILSGLLLSACGKAPDSQVEADPPPPTSGWQVGFFDDFDTFNPENWQDQLLWVNDEDQCYVRDGAYNTREVSDGTLKLRVVDLGEKRPCENMNKQ